MRARGSDRSRELRRLVNRRLGIQLGGLISTTDQIYLQTLGLQRVVQAALRHLPGTDDHRVDLKGLGLTTNQNVQASVVNTHVLYGVDHVDAATIQ